MKTTQEEALVSVIIPTHNRAEMLKRAIQSVQNQDYTNLEMIVVADNCQDNTAEVVKNIQDQRIIFIPTPENVGGAQARNIGLDRASGEYLAFLDDDDEWLPNKVRKQVEILKNDKNIAITTCQSLWISQQGETVFSPPSLIDLPLLLFRNYVGSFSFGMTTRQYLGELRITPALKSAQDWDLWIKILDKTQKKALCLPEVLVKYYEHEQPRISKTRQNWAYSFIKINRQNWHLYQNEHKYYQTYYLNYKQNDLLEGNFVYKCRLAYKTFLFLLKSQHYNLYALLESFAPLFGENLRKKVATFLQK